MLKISFWGKFLVLLAIGGLLALGNFWAVLPGFAFFLRALWQVDGRRVAWKGFATGFLVGVVCQAGQLYWLKVVSPLGAIVLPLYLALFSGLFGAFAATLGNPGKIRSFRHFLRLTFANAAVWSGLEWLRGWLFTGFAWNDLGVSFHNSLIISQSADVLGVIGLSLLLVWFAGLLVCSIFKNGGAKPFAAAALIAAAVTGYGFFRIHQEKGLATTPLRVLLVQINVPQEAAEKSWDPAQIHEAYENDTLAALEKAKAEGNFPDWVIWPESALTGRIMRTSDDQWGEWEENSASIKNIREVGDFTLIYGVNELESVIGENGQLFRKEGGKAYNSLAVKDPDDHLQTFRKHHLVIFGETIPFVDSIPFLKKIYEQQAGVEYGGSFSEGTSFEPLSAVAGERKIGIIPSVCFEDTVSRLLRRFVKQGPQVIVNITNDGWFKQSIASIQHFQNARFRAIELRRPMIRCANTGVTVALSSTGSSIDPKTGQSRILTGPPHGDHFTRNTLLTTLEIPLAPPTSLYSLIGDWGIILTGISGFILALVFRRRNHIPKGRPEIYR